MLLMRDRFRLVRVNYHAADLDGMDPVGVKDLE